MSEINFKFNSKYFVKFELEFSGFYIQYLNSSLGTHSVHLGANNFIRSTKVSEPHCKNILSS